MSECLECACAGPDKATMHVTLAAPPLRLGGEQALSISKGSKNLNWQVRKELVCIGEGSESDRNSNREASKELLCLNYQMSYL